MLNLSDVGVSSASQKLVQHIVKEKVRTIIVGEDYKPFNSSSTVAQLVDALDVAPNLITSISILDLNEAKKLLEEVVPTIQPVGPPQMPHTPTDISSEEDASTVNSEER